MTLAREAFIAEVAKVHTTYWPNDEVIAGVQAVELTTVTGGLGMGKDTVINATGVLRVLTETIRSPRKNNGILERNGVEYIFRGHELDAVLEDVRSGNYVQIGMGPGHDSFYGAQLYAFPPRGPVINNLMPQQVDYMRQLPFGSVRASYITAPSYDTLQQRAQGRGLNQQQWEARLVETRESLELGLNDERFVFILNDELEVAAASLKKLAIYGEIDRSLDIKARNCAAAILKRIDEL